MSNAPTVRGLFRPEDHFDRTPRSHTISASIINRTKRRLLKWGRRNYRDYPWRSEPDLWLSFVAEFLLQRTRASQVESVFDHLATHFPTAHSLAESDAHTAHRITARLGLHARGPQLLRIAKSVADQGGALPETIDKLCEFPGVGIYTASAWLSLHRGKRATLLDSNVCRWLSRMTGRPYTRDPRHVRWIQELAHDLTPRRAFREYNYSVLDFTMHVCTPRKPLCHDCPLSDDCLYSRSQDPTASLLPRCNSEVRPPAPTASSHLTRSSNPEHLPTSTPESRQT